jgi:hypothetical protein
LPASRRRGERSIITVPTPAPRAPSFLSAWCSFADGCGSARGRLLLPCYRCPCPCRRARGRRRRWRSANLLDFAGTDRPPSPGGPHSTDALGSSTDAWFRFSFSTLHPGQGPCWCSVSRPRSPLERRLLARALRRVGKPPLLARRRLTFWLSSASDRDRFPRSSRFDRCRGCGSFGHRFAVCTASVTPAPCLDFPSPGSRARPSAGAQRRA